MTTQRHRERSDSGFSTLDVHLKGGNCYLRKVFVKQWRLETWLRAGTRDQLTVHVLLPHCGLGMRMISPDVTRAGLHGQRGRRSLAATAVAKNSAADPSGHHLVTKLHLHAGGALPARHETTVAARNRLIGRRVVQLHGHECGSCLLYTSPSPRDVEESRMPSSA